MMRIGHRAWAVLLGAALVTTTAGLAAQRAGTSEAERRLERARQKEVIEGDPAGAIKDYQAIAETFKASQRPAAAQALLALATALDKMGDARAGNVYAQLGREFSDLPEGRTARARQGQGPASVSMARRDLAMAGDRVVWAGSAAVLGGRVSRDGRFVVHTDWHNGRLVRQDLTTGEERVLVEGGYGPGQGATSEGVLSPDGRLVAYGWGRGEPHAIRIVSVDGVADQPFRVLYANPDAIYPTPMDWSPDGQIAAVVRRPDNTHEIALIGVADGSFRRLKTVGWDAPACLFFSPDGRYLAFDLPASDDELQRDVFISAVDGSSEAQLDHPATEKIMGWSPDGRQLLFTSDRNTTVGLWSQPVANGRPQGQAGLLKPDVGFATSLGMSTTGALYVFKDASTLSLQVAPIDLDKGVLTGSPVHENVRSQFPRWSPDGKSLGYIFTAANGRKVIVIKSMDGTRREIQPNLGTYVRGPVWLPSGQFMLWGRDPKGRVGLYTVDDVTGRSAFFASHGVISDARVSPDGKKVYVLGRGPTEAIPYRVVEHDLATGASRDAYVMTRAEFRALHSPDRRSRAEGAIDPETRTVTVSIQSLTGGPTRVIRTAAAAENIRAFQWTGDGRAVLFITEVLSQPVRKELWLVTVENGQARKLDIDVSQWTDRYESVKLSPDGRFIAFSTGAETSEIARIETHLSGLPQGR